ncbi:unnamed protein product [Cylicocyclus nassatus]|uniref:Uncharacterized protein n=1 Tax=Cylicocyclus nassatus TaxID=53992 RepID=A0AA36DT70_CYLNA|nr:unnamed protein product [Cylicocyclus nassatus]
MVETSARGALSGVNELVSFLESASSSDRSAFSKRANVILECRTCATLFRKADGFMRHVMRCDSSRAADVDAELNGRSQLIPPPVRTMTAPKAVRPVKKPMADDSVPVPTKLASTMIAQELKKVPSVQELKKLPSVKRIGRPPNAEKASTKLAVAKNEMTETTSTPPVVAVASDNEPKVLPATRAPKRAYNRKSTTPQKRVVQADVNERY